MPLHQTEFKDAGVKFTPDGKVLTYYGNTIICLMNDASWPIYHAAKKAIAALRQSSYADKMAFLPKDSLHMTVISLTRELDRHTQYWSPHVPEDASFEEADRILEELVQDIPQGHDVQMRFDHVEQTKLILVPADEASAQALLEYREKISDITGIRHANHEDYRYHMSLDYALKPLTADEIEENRILCESLTQEFRQSLPLISLPKPRFVIFDNMLAYNTDRKKRGTLG